MHYRLLFRPPLVWVTIAECILVAAIAALSWHVWQSRHPSAPSATHVAAAPPVSRPSASGQALGDAQLRPPVSPTPAAAGAGPRTGPTPGTRTDPAFLSRQMVELNRVEATLEDLEWRMTKALVDGMQYYIEHVVVPGIERSEQGHR